jgi:hypothetical protein
VKNGNATISIQDVMEYGTAEMEPMKLGVFIQSAMAYMDIHV